jgi:hypothetical protein
MSLVKLPHNVIVKSPGLLPMQYMVSELTKELGVPDSTLRDWLRQGAPFQKDGRSHIWINGEDFARWVKDQKKPGSTRKLGDNEAYCMHCRAVTPLIDPEMRGIKGKLIHIKGKCFFVGTRSTAEVELVERKNFFKFRAYLFYLVEVTQVSQASADRYRFYLRHLLIWVGEKLLGEIASIRPTFPAYVASLPGKDGKESLTAETQKKIVDISKRFLLWAKANHPVEFSKLSSSFIECYIPFVRQSCIKIMNMFPWML